MGETPSLPEESWLAAGEGLGGPLITETVDADSTTMNSLILVGVLYWLLGELMAESASTMVDGADDDEIPFSAEDAEASDKARMAALNAVGSVSSVIESVEGNEATTKA